MKIGLVGAPNSGKTTLGAMLYAELLSSGVEGAYLIHEYAKEYIAGGCKFKNATDQFIVSNNQMQREEIADRTTFTPIICDSCVWLGALYAKLYTPKDAEINSYYEAYWETIRQQKYDMTIFVPLPKTIQLQMGFRQHNYEESLKIQDLILEELKNHTNVVDAPLSYKDRAAFIQEMKRGL